MTSCIPTDQSKDTLMCHKCGGNHLPDTHFVQPPQPNTDSLEEKLRELLKGSYACSRVWEAWQYGTMRQDDFYPLEEDDDVISDLAQLFNKYAREQVIAELEAIPEAGIGENNDLVPDGNYINSRIAELKEQREKLKENK